MQGRQSIDKQEDDISSQNGPVSGTSWPVRGFDDWVDRGKSKPCRKYHVEDREEDGPRLCFGTVTNSGFPKFAKNTMHWTVEFDEEDAVVYAHNGRGHLEDLNYDELMNAFELHKKKKEQDTKKPSVDCVV